MSSKHSCYLNSKDKDHEDKSRLSFKILFIFIILVILLLLPIFKKYLFNAPAQDGLVANYNAETSDNNTISNNISKKDVKTIDNYGDIEISEFNIENSNNQYNVYLTLYNNSSDEYSKLNLSINLLDSDGNIVVSFYSYIDRLSPNDSKTITMYTKEDVSQVTDFSVKRED